MVEGIIFDVKRFAIHDGPGIRTTIFFKGCPLTCWWCQNPESQSLSPELISNPQDSKEELVGRTVTVAELLAEVLTDHLFYQDTGGGVTFSGGEPLLQPNFLMNLARHCQEHDVHTVLDSTLYTKPKTFIKVMKHIDMVLADVKLLDGTLHLKYTGVGNKPILENLAYLDQGELDYQVRIPVIPTITDQLDNLHEIKKLLQGLENYQKITLLPYNKLGVAKYHRLGKPYSLTHLTVPSDQHMNEIVEFFKPLGKPVQVGG